MDCNINNYLKNPISNFIPIEIFKKIFNYLVSDIKTCKNIRLCCLLFRNLLFNCGFYLKFTIHIDEKNNQNFYIESYLDLIKTKFINFKIGKIIISVILNFKIDPYKGHLFYFYKNIMDERTEKTFKVKIEFDKIKIIQNQNEKLENKNNFLNIYNKLLLNNNKFLCLHFKNKYSDQFFKLQTENSK